eukprot:4481808-Pyramimonas_sp.AAC.1
MPKRSHRAPCAPLSAAYKLRAYPFNDRSSGISPSGHGVMCAAKSCNKPWNRRARRSAGT